MFFITSILIIMIVSVRMGIIQEVKRVDLEIEDTHSSTKLSIAFILILFLLLFFLFSAFSYILLQFV